MPDFYRVKLGHDRISTKVTFLGLENITHECPVLRIYPKFCSNLSKLKRRSGRHAAKDGRERERQLMHTTVSPVVTFRPSLLPSFPDIIVCAFARTRTLIFVLSAVSYLAGS